jgi:hypothetical protein
MNEGLTQLVTLLSNKDLDIKRIIFEIKEENVLTMGVYKGDYNSQENKFGFDVIMNSPMDLLSVILGNLLLSNGEKEENNG